MIDEANHVYRQKKWEIKWNQLNFKLELIDLLMENNNGNGSMNFCCWNHSYCFQYPELQR